MVCFFGVVRSAPLCIYPPHNIFGGISTFECVRKSTNLLSHNHAMSEQFFMPMVTVFRAQEVYLLAEFEERLCIILRFVGSVLVFRAFLDEIRPPPHSCLQILDSVSGSHL